MVSTRGPKIRYFEKGEKVLCYEPDPTKAKVLYNSKILGIYETKNKRNRKVIQYKVHFQGWSSTWDRKVNADFVLKDTEENRQLQRDLADKAKLQLGAYLYRKERSSNKSRPRKPILASDDSTGCGGIGQTSPKISARGSLSEDNFSSSSTLEKHEDSSMKDECDTESYCSSVESLPDEDRVLLRISEKLRQYLEYDHDMIVKYGKQHSLPARIPVIAVLEAFVKQSTVKMIFSTTQTENTRRRTTQQRTDKKEKDFDKIMKTVGLLKEVVDGLRIYFDFTITDYLLYKEEKDYALSYLAEENLKNFSYITPAGLSFDFLNPKSDVEQTNAGLISVSENTNDTQTTPDTANTPTSEEPQKRKLRSHRSDDCDLMIENCLSSMASTSSGASTPLHANIGGTTNINYLKSLQPMMLSVPPQIKEYLQTVLAWRLLPSNAAPAASMIFGAPHLARLIVKLPEFLNASTINDDKLKLLLQHLDMFVNYMESHKEWFNEDNYARSSSSKRRNSTEANKSNNSTDAETSQHVDLPSSTEPTTISTITVTSTTTTHSTAVS